MSSVRERVKVIQRTLREGSPAPETVREALMTLTALMGNVNDELREADLNYKDVLAMCYRSHEAANRARIEAETSPQYRRAREAKDMQSLVIELVRSCKVYLRSLDEEMRLAR